MSNIRKRNGLLSRFRENEDGNVTIMFGISVVAVVGLMGAAMDYSTMSSAKARSQSIADQTALSAAIFVKNNDRAPKADEEGVVEGQHSASSLGYDFKGWVDGGAENVSVNVVYDDNAGQFRVYALG